ncbi:SUMF1/EgtB/PvdO family nonheme iron enzyme [Autumnicola edwardsiae]|uniref:SUMF1/EgtB/PvdO family nonheme iron enzyme n=1 Tax=Autumnicola edwardsiae TaxID=3075594 RepID=A0ABU3CS07_9FLAO|nr:SUMF1/EgtB/PvdO family nonheme iron enzyme [Zunongwangia sp. F297]MDT0649144.1 SUMF1/EgtB/PvdO family nonheme iron enzyme [Zunongwangia sp. F297]
MKYYFTTILIFFAFAIQAQKLFETPPGTVRVNDSLYIDKGPVDNIMYLEFTDKVKDLWNLTLHDSLKSLELENINKSLSSHSLNPEQSKEIYNKIILAKNQKISDSINILYYFNHPEYQYHPVVGISKDRARLFCQWRTDMVNLKWSKEIKDDKRKYKKIKYRLPTYEEFELAKKTMEENNNLLLVNQNSPIDLDLKKLLNEDNFILLSIPEFTTSNRNFKEDSPKLKNTDKPNDDYIFFRCICEI